MLFKKVVLFGGLLVFVGMGACVGLRWPAREFKSWTPPKVPQWTGVLAKNKQLHKVEMLGGSTMVEPEDAVVGPDGWIYGSCYDGKIRRVDASGKKVEVFADTKGRPLGLVFDAKGNLLVADALTGLLSIDKAGKVTTLVTEYKGKKMRFVDDLDVDAAGRIYFSDVSIHYSFDFDTRPEIMARVPTGRLFRYDPTTKKTELMLGALHFANGVAMSHQQDYVLIAETSDYSIRRLWLKGPKAGQNDVFASNLPGFPDNINRSSQGGYWVALTSTRLPVVDQTLHPHVWLKKLVQTLPTFLLPKPIRASLVLHLDANGKISQSLHDPDGKVILNATSANEHKGHLYFGHIYHQSTGIGRLKL